MTRPAKIRALSLFSGGLDSLLATRVIANLGVEVLALHFTAPFISPRTAPEKTLTLQRRAAELCVPLRTIDVWPAYRPLLENPRFGFGKHLNPCIDCKIFFLREAGKIMRAEGFAFVFTGEVLGQRPMSQNRPSLEAIAKYSELNDRLLRPLTAKNLEPTAPEREGLIDRDKLHAFSGRGRKAQFALAAELGLTDPPGAAGGCLLTDAIYSGRLRRLLDARADISHSDLHLLTIGRHLLLPTGARLIVSRNEMENGLLAELREAGEVFLEPENWSGPAALLFGEPSERSLGLALGLMRRWGKAPDDGRALAFRRGRSTGEAVSRAEIPPEAEIQMMLQH